MSKKTNEETMFENFRDEMFKQSRKFHKAMEKTELYKTIQTLQII